MDDSLDKGILKDIKLEKIPVRNLENLIDHKLSQSLSELFYDYLGDKMSLSNCGKDTFNYILDGLEEKIFNPIRDILTKEHIKDILDGINKMQNEKELSSYEIEIKSFFENINDFYDNFNEKLNKLKKYDFLEAVKESNENFTNDTKDFIDLVKESSKKYDYIIKILNEQIPEEKNSDKETNRLIDYFKEMFKSVL